MSLNNPPKPLAQLPPLVMIRAFEAVGRTGSMRKAAEDIGVSHNVVSYHVRNLESWIGAPLMERSRRGVTLTADGQDFHTVVSDALAVIANAAVRLRPEGRQRILKVWCMPGLASRWLTPRLSQIKHYLPDTEIVVRPTETVPDFAQVAADLMIGFGMPQSLPPNAVPLVRPRVFPIASPRFLAKHGVPTAIGDLINYPLIHEESHAQWASWFVAGNTRIGEEQLTGARLWSANLCIDAAIAGQGIALGFAPLVQDCINDGQLVELFETDIRLGGYFLAAPPGRWANPILLRFRNWIESELI